MNTALKNLFEKYRVSEKDRYEINQIFELLPPDKKQNLLNNFETLVLRLERIHKEIDLERRILIGNLEKDIKSFYDKYSDKL